MKVAVVSEVSTANRNAALIAALEGRGLDLMNVGMKEAGPDQPELTYIHTGLLSAVLLNTRRADFVVAGCGTGQGYQMSVSQYPGVLCGHIVTPLDAWLFARINAGNCISLPLNQGYGWGGDVNLRLVFDQLFTDVRGAGYPNHRKASQASSRQELIGISQTTHRPLAEVIPELPLGILQPVLRYPGVTDVLDVDHLADTALADALRKALKHASS